MGQGVLILDRYNDIIVSLSMIITEYFPEAEVHGAMDAAGALRILDREPIALVLADDRTARAPPFTFFHDARAKAPDACHVLLTTDPRQETAVQAMEASGVDLVLSKPIEPGWFVEFLARRFSVSARFSSGNGVGRRGHRSSAGLGTEGHKYSRTRFSKFGK